MAAVNSHSFVDPHSFAESVDNYFMRSKKGMIVKEDLIDVGATNISAVNIGDSLHVAFTYSVRVHFASKTKGRIFTFCKREVVQLPIKDSNENAPRVAKACIQIANQRFFGFLKGSNKKSALRYALFPHYTSLEHTMKAFALAASDPKQIAALMKKADSFENDVQAVCAEARAAALIARNRLALSEKIALPTADCKQQE